ncbi:MAG: beta-phosphoglucomutase [Verrucomicrobiota bacterium]
MQPIKAVIFDLDGVIVSTDEYHFQAWQQLALTHGIPFNRADNERLRGVSRMESLAILLEKSDRRVDAHEQQQMAEAKNTIYQRSLGKLSAADILPGVMATLRGLAQHGVPVAIGSSSRNASTILAAIGLAEAFDTVVDGTHIRRSKPDPEVFTLAATRLGIAPGLCLVVEDADAGVDAGLAAGMRVLAVGSARCHPGASRGAADLASLSAQELLLIQSPQLPSGNVNGSPVRVR